jgi:L-lactate utilization protein LutC
VVIDRYVEAARANSVVVHGPLGASEIAATVAAVAYEHAGDAAVALNDRDELLRRLGIEGALDTAGLRVLSPEDPDWRADLPGAGAGVTSAALAVAETGTLVLPCGPERPRGTHIVPPVHLCVLRAADVVESFADAVAQVAGWDLPSNVSWVGGPSRTADLEMRQTIGIHGPRVVEVVLVDGG